MTMCCVEGCQRKLIARGMCTRHYGFLVRNGSPTRVLRPWGATIEQRFWAKVEKTEACWLWTGAKSHGYGNFYLSLGGGKYKQVQAHRWAYEAVTGPIPDGLVLDHLCRVKRCVNPRHLEPVPQRVNVLRGELPRALRENRCVNGHEYTPENTFVNSLSVRVCRVCMRAAQDRRNDRDRQRRGPAPADRTHCPQGHPYDEANTYVDGKGARSCRTCNREKMRRRRAAGPATPRVAE